MDVRFPSSALRAAAEAAAAAARPDRSAAIGGVGGGPKALPGGSTVGGVEQGGFSTVLSGALKEISATQQAATDSQQAFQVGAPGATLESTMMSMQKAQLGFQTAVTVRNRLVSAYTEIMNMQV